MWIVKLALRRPYTFAVMAIAILIAGLASFRQTPKDIFPEIDIPVIRVLALGERQRPGTHRITNLKWGRHHQTLFPSGRESGTRPCPGHGDQSGDSATYATWRAAAHHSAIRG